MDQIQEAIERYRKFEMPLYVGIAGQQVLYVPTHINNVCTPKNWGYPNGIQPGFISSSVLVDDNSLFVRYWLWDYQKKIFLPELRTKANSALTPKWCLHYFDFFNNDQIVSIIAEVITGGSHA